MEREESLITSIRNGEIRKVKAALVDNGDLDMNFVGPGGFTPFEVVCGLPCLLLLLLGAMRRNAVSYISFHKGGV